MTENRRQISFYQINPELKLAYDVLASVFNYDMICSIAYNR